MAVAELHDVSAIDSSLFRDSQSPVSRRWSNQDRHAPSLLQMWLQRERVLSHSQAATFKERHGEQGNEGVNDESYSSEGQRSENGDSVEDSIEVENEIRTCSQGQICSESEDEGGGSYTSEQCTDLGKVERERVRQIFREWKNSGERGDAAIHVSHMNNRSRTQQRPGENELAAETGSQIEQVRVGLVGNHSEIGNGRVFRRLRGRQVLLDLLMKAERERKTELQGLLEHRPVTDFGHRNRIQSLLKGRFLRTKTSIKEESYISVAATELGLLRERHTVSGLREGFLSRLGNSVTGSITSAQSSVNDHYGDVQSQGNNFPDEHSDQPANYGRETDEDVPRQELTVQAEETTMEEQVLEIEEQQQQQQQPQSSNIEHGKRIVGTGGSNVVENWLRIFVNGSSSQETQNFEERGQNHLQFDREVSQEQNHEQISEEINEQMVPSHYDGLEGSNSENFHGQENSAQMVELHQPSSEPEAIASTRVEEWQESSLDNEENDWQQLASTEFSEMGESQWYQEPSENNRLHDSPEEWHENDLQEALDSWLDGSSSHEAAPVEAFHLSGDDNEHITELSELSSRRRVSNLLQSGFRERLDRLIQSYVERQAHASDDWELEDGISPPSSPSVVQEQSGSNLDDGQQNMFDITALVLPSPSVISSQPLLDQHLHDGNCPFYNSHQCLGNEWEILNEMRIEMARLQQRMNNMQGMLETCMDMQLELQRSVRQELSAALNRKDGSAGVSKESLLNDEAKWDSVRKGICCVCCDNHIDTLLYRCGHLCTCSKCAEELVQGSGKCPMCQAPVVEVIRAYFTQ